MKKLLFAILILLAFTLDASAASYYGCASAAINADNTFCTTATGSCAGDTPVSAAVALAGTHTLFANGCTITIPEALAMTTAKLSNKDDGGAMVDGGQFTVTTTGWTKTTTSITAEIEAGATVDCLAISGNANLNPVLTILGGPITGGGATGIDGVQDTHTLGTVVVGAAGSLVTINGGYAGNGVGYRWSGATGTVTFNAHGNAGASTTAAAHGIYVDGNAVSTVNGNCTGHDGVNLTYGCSAAGTGAMTITGNINNGLRASGAQGNIAWAPAAASNYIFFKAGTDIYASTAPDKAKVLSDTSVVISTTGAYEAGTATSGGGGAWAY